MKSLFFTEYKRLLRSRATFIILIPVLIAGIAFCFTLSDKRMWLEMLEAQLSNPAPDINMTALTNLANSYGGPKFLTRYWFVQFSDIETIVFFLWTGIFLSADMFITRAEGCGNFMVTRIPFRKYSAAVVGAQSLYILTVVFLSSFAELVLAWCFGGFSFFYTKVGRVELNAFTFSLIFMARVLLLSANLCAVNILAGSLEILFPNRFVLQAAPILIPAIMIIVCSTAGNVYIRLGRALQYFSLDSINMAIEDVLSAPSWEGWWKYLFPLMCYTLGAAFFYLLRLRKQSREYV